MRSGDRYRLGRRGFSLLEILGAMAVIVVIMTMLAMGVRRLLPLSKSKQAHTDIVYIQQALEAYKSSFGEYPRRVTVGGSEPPMEEILFNALTGRMAPNGVLGNFPVLLDRSVLEFSNNVFPIAGESPPQWKVNAILDPWGTPFQYRYDTDDPNWENYNYVLFSAGPDARFADVTGEGQPNAGNADNVDNIYAE
jgi:prepilin-type N-terminal cleavage/methylation domain-containing protein